MAVDKTKLEELKQKLLEVLGGKVDEKPKSGIDLSKLPVLLQVIDQLVKQLKELRETETQDKKPILYIVKENGKVVLLTSKKDDPSEAIPLVAISCDKDGSIELDLEHENFEKIYIVQGDEIQEYKPKLKL